jgi:hypothetical protein
MTYAAVALALLMGAVVWGYHTTPETRLLARRLSALAVFAVALGLGATGYYVGRASVDIGLVRDAAVTEGVRLYLNERAGASRDGWDERYDGELVDQRALPDTWLFTYRDGAGEERQVLAVGGNWVSVK